jgi:hypothetical protein
MINQFINQSGLKLLAIANLSQCEYSLVLYLLNCTASGFKQIISTENELSVLLNQEEKDIEKALDSLVSQQIVKSKQTSPKNLKSSNFSLSLSVELDMSKWNLASATKDSPHEALILPLARYDKTHLELIKTSKDHEKIKRKIDLVTKAFYGEKKIPKKEQQETERAVRVLVKNYPVDYILLLLKHFQGQIKNLSLLASSWEHFQTLYDKEAHQVDFISAKSKHDSEDENLKKIAKKWLKEHKKHKLTDEEIDVLQVIAHHQYPRRQLFWAYRLKDKYTNLEEFFAINHTKMLPITSSGVIVKKPPEE